MTLSYLDGVNRMLGALGEDEVSSLTSGGTVCSNRCKIYINDAWTNLVVKQRWSWLSTTFQLSSVGGSTPDVFNVSGGTDIRTLQITQDNLATTTLQPSTDDVVLLQGSIQIEEDQLWTPGLTITLGEVVGYAANQYVATSAGTTSTSPPVHTTGIVSDGGVNWRWQAVFSLAGSPFAWSKLNRSQIRMRPYPGPLNLQRYKVEGRLAPFRLVEDTDVFTNMPVEFEPAFIDMALAIASAKHLDDPQGAQEHRDNAKTQIDQLKTNERGKYGSKRLRMTNYGILL